MTQQTRLHYENHLLNREKLPHKLLPPIQITTDLPCPEDEDLDEVPRPAYMLEDINRVQRILLRFVPAELADAILDMAEYWPWVGVSRNSFASAYSALDAPDKNAQWCYLVTPRVPALELKGAPVPTVVKKVRFLVKTYDSRWGNKDRPLADDFKTWFEASILDHDDLILKWYPTKTASAPTIGFLVSHHIPGIRTTSRPLNTPGPPSTIPWMPENVGTSLTTLPQMKPKAGMK